MAIDRETREQALSGISVAAATLIEEMHDELVATLPDDALGRAVRFASLGRLGADLAELAEACEGARATRRMNSAATNVTASTRLTRRPRLVTDRSRRSVEEMDVAYDRSTVAASEQVARWARRPHNGCTGPTSCGFV